MCLYVQVSAAPSGRTWNDSSLCLLKLITIFTSRMRQKNILQLELQVCYSI